MKIINNSDSNNSIDIDYGKIAMARYCVSQEWEYNFGGAYTKIDIIAKTRKNKYIGIELMRSSCWTTQSIYPEPYIYIPRRKWRTFYEQTQDITSMDISRPESAYLMVFNVEYTRAGVINFLSILKPLAMFEEKVLNIDNIFVLVPIKYIQKYIDIPPE